MKDRANSIDYGKFPTYSEHYNKISQLTKVKDVYMYNLEKKKES